ncbi:peptidase S8/S53 domain-containing protein [Lentinula lateritia]|uniref:Peptidase S8/S53 domain-containing protein n=1 Tax=Lentinula aff. lateritia TaxID=2804960 RepID=A0ACC1UA45_9AGAR|nr:peptidase S8/S53 domain-containing protein [Lentinula aff. lateritia]KAJ3853855.1 peptidase S8/S53 domain-containing protein [Lentinula lateritia]
MPSLKLTATALLSLLPLQVFAGPSVLRSRESNFDVIPPGFTLIGIPPSDSVIDIRIALKAADNAGLQSRLYEVSTPGSASYGQYLTKDQIKTYAAPSSDSITAVTSWLLSQNVSATSTGPSGEYLSFSIPVSEANNLLNAEYTNFTYSSPSSSTSQVTHTWGLYTSAYSIPSDLAEHITLVHPSIAFAPPVNRNGRTILYPKAAAPARTTASAKFATRANTAPASCETLVPPSCLQSLYGIPSTPATQPSNVLGVASLQSNWALETDLEAFLTEYRQDIPSNTTFILVSVDNGTNPQEEGYASYEASLDVQYTVGIATDVPTDFISVGNIDTDFFTSLTDLAEYLITADDPPQVVTTSYGVAEGFLTASEAGLMEQACNSFMQATSRGISLMFASGMSNSSHPGTTNLTLFTAFPAACPYVTAVGSVTGINPEVASNFSGGGFSDYFSRPSYQDTIVSSYLSSIGSANEGLYNTSGRAVPDIAAQGENIPIITNGRQVLELGTSASSPIFASVISLVNDRLVAEGKPVLGFLNPFIYSNPQAFFDIVDGSTPGLVPADCQYISSLPFWDPATGFGTPNFNAIVAAAGL